MIYLYDGSRDGFLTAFLFAFPDNESMLVSAQRQLVIGQETLAIKTDTERANRAAKRLLSFDRDCLHDLETLLRSGDAERDLIAYRYLELIAMKKRPVRNMLAEDAVIDAMECIRRVSRELDRMYGFVRFMESAGGALYAPVSPDNDIYDLLARHFRARLPQFPFVIHDVKRKKAAVYDGEHLFYAPLENADVVLSADEEEWQNLWRKYFDTVNIVPRERLRQQRAFLPVRYRKFMPEFH